MELNRLITEFLTLPVRQLKYRIQGKSRFTPHSHDYAFSFFRTSEPLSFAFTKGSQFKEFFDIAILKFQQSGLLDQIRRKYRKNSFCGRTERDVSELFNNVLKTISKGRICIIQKHLVGRRCGRTQRAVESTAGAQDRSENFKNCPIV